MPLEDNGFQVFIKRAFVINDAMAVARARAGVQSVMAASLAGGGNGGLQLRLSTQPRPRAGETCCCAGLAFGSVAWPRRRLASTD